MSLRVEAGLTIGKELVSAIAKTSGALIDCLTIRAALSARFESGYVGLICGCGDFIGNGDRFCLRRRSRGIRQDRQERLGHDLATFPPSHIPRPNMASGVDMGHTCSPKALTEQWVPEGSRSPRVETNHCALVSTLEQHGPGAPKKHRSA